MMLRPQPTIASWSTYTVLGIAGYACAAILVGVLGEAANATLAERALAIAVPPFGFWIAVAAERGITGIERIVFYRAAVAAWSLTIIVAGIAGARLAVVSDLVVVLVAGFLAFGRLGCFHVACCHGRPARFGVRYTHVHARIGFPMRWVGKRVLPIQLVEAAASAVLAVIATLAIDGHARAGTATSIVVVAYACVRFVLELLRGDAGRPHAFGVSEAQWWALSTSITVAAATHELAFIVAAGLLIIGVAALALRRSLPRAIRHPDHIDELESLHRVLAVQDKAVPVITSAGLRVSVRRLDDGALDLLWSHERLRARDVIDLARDLAYECEILGTSKTTMFHVVLSADDQNDALLGVRR